MTAAERERLLADLSAYLDGELPAARVQEVERGLADSPEARQLLAELRQVRDRLHALPRRAAPAELATAVLRQAESRLAVARRQSSWSRRILRLGAPLAAAAAVLLLGLLVRQSLHRAPPTTVPLTAERGAAARDDVAPPAAAVGLPLAASEEFAARAAPPASDELTRAMYAAGEVDEESPGADGPLFAVVIQTQNQAEYATNAALLASWSAPKAPAAAGNGTTVGRARGPSPGAAGRAERAASPVPTEYDFELEPPAADALLAELLETNARDRVTVHAQYGTQLGLVPYEPAELAAPAGPELAGAHDQAVDRPEREQLSDKSNAAPAHGTPARDEPAKRERVKFLSPSPKEGRDADDGGARPASLPPPYKGLPFGVRGAPPAAPVGGMATQPAPEKVRFRVRLLPPTASATAPATQAGR